MTKSDPTQGSTAGDKEFEGTIAGDEIFKSLGHKVRRDIIKFIGKEKGASFSAIKSAVGSIDSPSLAYHLKSLQPMLVQKEGAYTLSELGAAAYKLLTMTSESARVVAGKRMFGYAFIITLACWVTAQCFVPFLFDFGPSDPRFIIYEIIINVISSTNFSVINQLRNRF